MPHQKKNKQEREMELFNTYDIKDKPRPVIGTGVSSPGDLVSAAKRVKRNRAIEGLMAAKLPTVKSRYYGK